MESEEIKEQRQSVYELISDWHIDLVENAHVMVVGAGALGNEVLKNLALLGVGHILVVDFDTIDYTNLSRSVLFRASDAKLKKSKAEVVAERVKEINPNVDIQFVHGDIMTDIGLGVFRRMDAIVGCLDNRIARLYLNRLSFRVGKPWINAGIELLSGQVTVYERGIACYESKLSAKEWETITARLGCSYLTQMYESYGRVATTPIAASIMGAVQAQEAIKLIHRGHSIGKNTLAGQTFYYHGSSNESYVADEPKPVSVIRKSTTGKAVFENESDEYMETVVEAEPLGANSTFRDVLDWAAQKFEYPGDDIFIQLRFDFVTKASREGEEFTPLVIKPKVGDRFADQTKTIVINESTSSLNTKSPHLDIKLSDAGIPRLEILKVAVQGIYHNVELSADASSYDFINTK